MWIRGQDKSRLTRGHYSIKIYWFPKEGWRITTEGDYEDVVLGAYETEERALKVLDYIQNAIKKGEKVYTMPEN